MSSKARLSFPEEDRLLDIDAIAWLFDLTREAVYNRRHRNDFPPPAIKVGNSLRWRLGDIHKWLEDRREVAEA
jgi:predicted DNA-binding transcriptional regulator AlpA